jgi:dTDP-4-amino-4,6-dideoxygalactose transaminase
MNRPIYVTKPFLPPLEEYMESLRSIWDSGILTNGGPFHDAFESRLAAYLGVEHVSLVCNATIGLILALQALRIEGEVITTPYTFVATAHSLLWTNNTPVFVDIDPVTLNLDPRQIEAAITPHTRAILPVHCYGNPCAVEQIQEIADNYNLRVIYDAAHAFGVRHRGQSVLKWGDLSVLSFHATKMFNTFEGGAIVSADAKTKRRIDKLKNFGFVGETVVAASGINGKMNELSAAMGLLQLEHADGVRSRRLAIDARYRRGLEGLAGIEFLRYSQHTDANFAYFPIFIGESAPITRDGLHDRLRQRNIFTRRYFYPIIPELQIYKRFAASGSSPLTIARNKADKVLCLPIYPDLGDDELDAIIASIREAF